MRKKMDIFMDSRKLIFLSNFSDSQKKHIQLYNKDSFLTTRKDRRKYFFFECHINEKISF